MHRLQSTLEYSSARSTEWTDGKPTTQESTHNSHQHHHFISMPGELRWCSNQYVPLPSHFGYFRHSCGMLLHICNIWFHPAEMLHHICSSIGGINGRTWTKYGRHYGYLFGRHYLCSSTTHIYREHMDEVTAIWQKSIYMFNYCILRDCANHSPSKQQTFGLAYERAEHWNKYHREVLDYFLKADPVF